MFRGIAPCGQGAESAFLDGAEAPWTRLTRGENLASFALDTRRRNHSALRKADRAWAPPEARHRLGAVARASGRLYPCHSGWDRSGQVPLRFSGVEFWACSRISLAPLRRSHVVLRPARYNSPAVRRIRTGFLPLSLPSSRRAFAGFGALWLCCVPAALRHGLARFQACCHSRVGWRLLPQAPTSL